MRPEVCMELDPKALSDDGYIIDQRRTKAISFGGCPSSKNGCGWIAAYNFLKALDRTPNPEVSRSDLSSSSSTSSRRASSRMISSSRRA